MAIRNTILISLVIFSFFLQLNKSPVISATEGVKFDPPETVYFQCHVRGNIPTTVFINPNGYIEKVALIEWTNIENGEKKCFEVSRKLELAFKDNSYKYIIPAHSSDGRSMLCKSADAKKKRIRETVCNKQDVLIVSEKEKNASEYLKRFYRTAFSSARHPPMLESKQALLNDIYEEPYIDIRQAINRSTPFLF